MKFEDSLFIVRSVVDYKNEVNEIVRLRQEQIKARWDEVFGGFSPDERVKYDEKRNRIHELEQHISERRAAAALKPTSLRWRQ